MIQDKVIDNSLHVHDILRNISKAQELEATVVFSENDIDRGFLYYLRKEKQLYFRLAEPDERYDPGMRLNISFILKETVFNFDTVIMNVENGILELNPPAVFKSSFKRYYSRYSPSNSEQLVVKLPDGTLHDVKDITTSGVAFYSDKLIYGIDSRIRNMEILLDGDAVCLDADVRYIIQADDGNYFYGTEFTNNGWFSHYSLFEYIFKQTYPDMKQIFDFSKEDIYMLYENSGYFGLKDRSEIDVSFEYMYTNLKEVVKYPQLTSNPVFVHNKKMYMGASVLRVYNRTFIAQHLASLPESRLLPGSKHSIYLGISDYLICNPYFEYYLTYFIARNRWHSRMYGNIGGYIDDDTKYLCDTLESFQIFFNEFNHTGFEGYEAITLDDNSEFAEFAEKNIPFLIRKTMAYGKENIELDEIKQIYGLIGLYLDRRIIKITKNDKTMAYAVCEAYSSGLNLFDLLDTIHIYPVEVDVDLNPVMDSLMQEARYFFDQYNKKAAYIFIRPDSCDKDAVNIKGIRYYDLLGRGIASKGGIIEYKNLLLNMSR